MNLICLQIDLGRQKENPAYVKDYIDFAAANGYNSVLLYLENAVRTEDTQFFHHEDTYSAEEILDIVAHAEQKGIDLIPAFENLGHMEKFLAYKELEHLLNWQFPVHRAALAPRPFTSTSSARSSAATPAPRPSACSSTERNDNP